MALLTPDYARLIRDGLPPAQTPRRVLVLGAGLAGLAAAHALVRAGHTPLVLEAQNRVGGRVCTLREPFSDGLYAEAGAMRIPRAHTLTMAYVEHFRLPTLPFTMGNRQCYYYLHGRRYRIAEATANPDVLGFDCHPHERGQTHDQLWQAALAPLFERLRVGGEAAWDELLAEYDQYSTREFLEKCGWSEGAIEMFGLLADQEALMNSSFLELFREEAGRNYVDLVQIEGGMDHLPRAFLPALRQHIRFGARVVALEQTATGVTAHYTTPAGRFRATGDYAIVALPFPALRHVEILQPFSRGKQRAIRQLHYDASAKIWFQCRRRFWEEDEGIFGGGTTTDLPIRVVYYPDHGRETGRGVILASYTWSEDAQRWGSLGPEARLVEALDDLTEIHPQVRAEFECGASKMWHDDEFAGGAFALFDPGQQTLLYRDIIAPEGRIFFAGEHASLHHAWIQGAIESGLREAATIHALSQA
ncbi:MAG: FAD-dependent oxidoreductase [Anaerolineales bacterium]|nr:FAD-dependent oxidoreductase [Anaerolineales bacterium]